MDKWIIRLSVGGGGNVTRRVVNDVIEDDIVVVPMMTTTTPTTTVMMMPVISAIDGLVIDGLVVEVIGYSDDGIEAALVVGLDIDEEVGPEGAKTAFGVLFDEMRRPADLNGNKHKSFTF